VTAEAVPGSEDWLRRWTIDAGSVTLRPVTRRVAQSSRRLLERQGFRLTGPEPGTDEVRYSLDLG
jgi:hypothetical protein